MEESPIRKKKNIQTQIPINNNNDDDDNNDNNKSSIDKYTNIRERKWEYSRNLKKIQWHTSEVI